MRVSAFGFYGFGHRFLCLRVNFGAAEKLKNQLCEEYEALPFKVRLQFVRDSFRVSFKAYGRW